ncbi:TPA: pyocin immunity protein [Escherichia coli]|nr:pyocin immunity protein [Escherichia coli]HBA6810387.1 pyocin immunity protein [Escherichia coli]HBA6820094.1 pyocin immunity protein [Escherichia coli]HBA8269883.1 pyocin immunity protein [Escherichia coli]HBA8732731.1 pyocin immunity protein [Escherichia coli]
MTLNVHALINKLGKSYQDIFNEGLIPYKTKPTGFSGDDEISLDMVKEGVFLSFKRDNQILTSITLRLFNETVGDFTFPNKLPVSLIPEMSRVWVCDNIGFPAKSLPPRKRLKKDIGWTDLYNLSNFAVLTSMQIDYDLNENARRITFMPTEDVRW